MNRQIQKQMEELQKEMDKDRILLEKEKDKQIKEIKSFDRSKMFIAPPKEKLSFFKRIQIVLGNGKTR